MHEQVEVAAHRLERITPGELQLSEQASMKGYTACHRRAVFLFSVSNACHIMQQAQQQTTQRAQALVPNGGHAPWVCTTLIQSRTYGQAQHECKTTPWACMTRMQEKHIHGPSFLLTRGSPFLLALMPLRNAQH
eukprot:1160588-Pelagomonas_calceolata.AAC.1